ncbi:FAD-binding oxidoreductase [Radiobacillus kanasensis]|uniref:NAD(P)/FAD-dependent oxidoreductase n=1 Tax=Radiobacillus kanasensis TaxID=2844358 RepID=UPI001E4E8FFD|nr:FAD-dependent oxidoreductase [Radiobacillus kanasensis]UFT99681.1 FAD-binding oxidoreductase [Radiobacillus kanasensis]
MSETIVIGAGILGVSTAYHLAKSGQKVTIVDREEKGQATDAAAGIVCPWLSQRRNKAWYALARGGAAYYPTLIRELEDAGESSTGYAQVGTLSIHSDPKKLEAMVKRAEKRREEAPEIGELTILTPEEAKAMFPPLLEGYGAVHVSGGARVDGTALRNALLRATRKLGAEYIRGEARLWADGGMVKGAYIDDQKMNADQVVVTAGAWAKELFKPLRINFEVEPQKAQIVHLRLKDTDTSQWPVLMPPSDHYVLSFDQGRVVVGTTHENGVGFDTRVTASGVKEILDKALHIAPGLVDAELLETRVGFRPVTPNFLPVFGQVQQFKGLYTANGLGSSGLTSGPFIGKQLASCVLGKQTDVDMELYNIAQAIQ